MYRDLSHIVDLGTFNEIQDSIHIGISSARSLAVEGTWSKQLVDNSVASSPINFKLLEQAYREFLALPDNDPVKLTGLELLNTEPNVFGTYLKIARQAYDCFYYYDIIKNGSVNPLLLPHFSNLVNWIEKSKSSVFAKIEKTTIIVCEAMGTSWEHKELDSCSDFLYIRPNLQRPVYLWDESCQERTYVNTCVATWSLDTWQGADRILEQSYALKIEGIFKNGVIHD